MPKYLIERKLPNAGRLSTDELREISGASNTVLGEMRGEGKNVQWVQSYVTGDALHCVYVADNEELVREHARRGGFPCDGVEQVATMIDATTGER